VPLLARSPASATRTIGGIAQAGGAMVLVGAPMAGAIIEFGSWRALAFSFAVVAVILLALSLRLWRRAGLNKRRLVADGKILNT
jgi:MFS family permease